MSFVAIQDHIGGVSNEIENLEELLCGMCGRTSWGNI